MIVAVAGIAIFLAIAYSCRASLQPGSTRSHISGKMNAVRSDSIGGIGVTLTPRDGSYDGVVIWMHGLGDTADGWAAAMPEFTVPKTKYILPTAPKRRISLNGGMPMPGWSDIYGLDISSEEDKAGFEESRLRVEKIMESEISNGISPGRIIIAGFSQGGALALHTALRSSVSVGGCVVLSSWLPFRSEYPSAKTSASDGIKVFQAHGTADNVVRFTWGKSSHELLQTLTSTPPEFLSIDGMGHSSHPREMAAVDNFLKSVLLVGAA